jgi:hypothetical protein
MNPDLLLPMSPVEGPPLPRFLNIYWPWYEKVTIKKVTIRLANYPFPVMIQYTVYLYDSTGTKVLTVENDPILGSLRPLDATLEYTIPDGWEYPLKMVYMTVPDIGDFQYIKQSVSPSQTGPYDPNFIIPKSGSYVIDYVTVALTEG